MEKKKFNVITKLEDDPPFENLNWFTVSFLTPQKIESLKHLDVKGIKIHNAYNTTEMANLDANKIKESKPNHDVFVAEMGKIHAWDDATKSDMIEYNDQKLNDLEKTRRQNIEKVKLMNQQFKNEYQQLNPNINNRKNKIRSRIHKKLYERGEITKQEYEMLLREEKTINEAKSDVANLAKLQKEIAQCQTDYLDENEPVAFKYACLTIYSPYVIRGLTTLCFKLRGIFQTDNDAMKRIKKLKELYPKDNIYKVEVGKWCAFCEYTEMDNSTLPKLNYAMKCYLDNIVNEKEEFEKRKESLQSQTEKEAQKVKKSNKRERRLAKKQNKKKDKNVVQEQTQQTSQREYVSVGTTQDKSDIDKIFNFLDDPELRNKFPADKNIMETSVIDVNNN